MNKLISLIKQPSTWSGLSTILLLTDVISAPQVGTVTAIGEWLAPALTGGLGLFAMLRDDEKHYTIVKRKSDAKQ